MIRVCFVCLGNICRSPTAHGVMQWLVAKEGLGHAIAVESAGTIAHHAGELPDQRTRKAALARGVELKSRARQFLADDFTRFDYILAMDRKNHENLLAIAPDATARGKVALFRSFDPQSPANAEVPDPYYGGPEGFDEVFDICHAGCHGLLAHLRQRHTF